MFWKVESVSVSWIITHTVYCYCLIKAQIRSNRKQFYFMNVKCTCNWQWSFWFNLKKTKKTIYTIYSICIEKMIIHTRLTMQLKCPISLLWDPVWLTWVVHMHNDNQEYSATSAAHWPVIFLTLPKVLSALRLVPAKKKKDSVADCYF